MLEPATRMGGTEHLQHCTMLRLCPLTQQLACADEAGSANSFSYKGRLHQEYNG